MISTMNRTFGWSLQPIGRAAMFHARGAVNALFGGLDHVLYPAIRSVKLDRPVFVLGNARSGTTLMHRVLARAPELRAFQLWEMLFPSISARKLLARRAERLASTIKLPHNPAIHETGLLHAETDDVLCLAQSMDGPLFWAVVLAWDPDFPTTVLGDEAAQARAWRVCLDTLDAGWRRNVVLSGRRVLAKSSGLGAALPQLISRYPDARAIYMMRSPISVIPSGMSLLEDAYVRPLSARRSPGEARVRGYYENIYRASCELYRRFHEDVSRGVIPKQNLHIVSYRRLMAQFSDEMAGVLDFAGVDPGGLAPVLAEVAPGQRDRASGHRYTLEQYGIDEARVRRDLSFIFDNYDV